MTRLVLLVILALATWYYFPETRAMLADLAEPVVVPIMRWSTEEEMAQVAQNVVDHERLTRQLPTGPRWLDCLEFRYASDEARTDPWGSTYQLSVSADSVRILSYGPDRTRDTADDFSVLMSRNP